MHTDHLVHICQIIDITSQKEAETALIESEKKFRNITENMSDVVWQTDLNLVTTYISPSVERLLGESAEAQMMRKPEEKFPPQALAEVSAMLVLELEKEQDPLSDKNRSRIIEVEHYKADGTVIWLEMNISFVRDAAGKAVGFQGASRDITSRKLAEIALKENERRESVLLSHLPGLAYRCNYDDEWTMQVVSEGCLNLAGYPAESLLYNRDLSFNDLIAGEYRDVIRKEWERVLAVRQPFRYEYEIIAADGRRKWVLEMGQGIFSAKGNIEALEGIILDISASKHLENRLRYLSEHDHLTGLFNRDHLEAQIARDIQKGDGLKRALVSINLSTVQLLVANYGFHYTQDLIKKAAQVLSRFCTDRHQLFQTFENRFVFYLTNYQDRHELLLFSEAIAGRLETLLAAERISGGIGVLEIEQSDTEIDVDLLLRRLLIASERSLAVSTNDFEVCFYDEDLEAMVNREREIMQALAGIAAEESGDELFLQYQPIMSLQTSNVFSFEALARLRTKSLGLVSPAEFIPLAEVTKLIIPLGELVIVSAFHFLHTLKERGYDEIGVSINISAIQLLAPDFADRLFESMEMMQISPRNVSLEITESVFVSDYDDVNIMLETLRGAGVHIAIDDFGTGHSSLAREEELKVDFLKIDKYFIDKLQNKDLSTAITSDIISMSHKLGHKTIAEGVEYENQLHYLRAHGCDMVQGYLISKPLPEADVFEFLGARAMKDRRPNSDAGQI
ncbi:MAG TPA: EAL domain-containing protein [Clostridiaceae bacterium]|nr:EAL domain-containing protein [Clostridiaceae bacterium]